MQPDAPRVGGITEFLKVMQLADYHGLSMAPHFAMEIHLHLAAAYPREPWLEHFEWLEPLFNERLVMKEGRMLVPDRPGLGFSLSEQARAWTKKRSSAASALDRLRPSGPRRRGSPPCARAPGFMAEEWANGTLGAGCPGQVERELRADPGRAFAVDLASVAPHDGRDEGQAQSAALGRVGRVGSPGNARVKR
ncbi:hypothetical protein CDEF62S_04431 [Castellaniella defragrans]